MKSLTQIAYDNSVAGGKSGDDARNIVENAVKLHNDPEQGFKTLGDAIEFVSYNLGYDLP